jgi:hypothetical protein
MTKQPTIKQMLNRSYSGHRILLEKISADQELDSPSRTESSLRGLRTCADTLENWGCLRTEPYTPEGGSAIPAYRFVITERGRELLSAVHDRMILS